MFSFLRKYKNGIFTVLGVAAPVVAGIVSGGVLTVPVAISAAGIIAAKLAASPIDHTGTLEHALATAAAVAKLAAPAPRSEAPTPPGRPAA